MKRIARRNAVALAATVASCTLLAPRPALAGSAVADGRDFVVTAAAGETYTVDTAIGNYARLEKKGAGEAVLTAVSTAFAGTAVVEEGTLSITRLRALGDTAPVVVESGATFYLNVPHGSSFGAHKLTISGDGADGKGAFRYLPSDGGATDDSLLGVLNLAADATIECDYRWGAATVNLNGHRLRRIRNNTTPSLGSSQWMLNGTTVNGPGTVEAYGGRIVFMGDVKSSADVTYVATNAATVANLYAFQTTRDIPSALVFFPGQRFEATGSSADHNRFSGPIRLADHAGSASGGYVTFAVSSQNALRLDGPIAADAKMSFNTSGDGSLFLGGDVSVARDVYPNSGTFVAMTSTASRVYASGFYSSGGSLVLVGDGRTFFNKISVGSGSNKGAFRQTGGVIGANAGVVVGESASGVSHWTMSGGEAHASNDVQVAKSAGSFGSFVQTGGLFKLDGGNLFAGNAGTAVFHVAGGTNDTRVTLGGQGSRFRIGEGGGTSDVTVSGEGTLLATETLRFGGGGVVSTNVFAVKDGATVKAARFFKHREAAPASLVVVSADGGTLMPTFGYDWTGWSQTDPDYFKGNPDHFVIWSKGLVIDTSESSGNNPTNHMPFSFESPSGKGVASVALPTEEAFTNAVYIGPARIVFEDETGWGASAYAEYDYDAKKLARVVLTSRGCDFGDNAKAYVESPDRTTRYECALVLSDNAGLGGELIKRGTYDLHLYAANTTTGGIAVESGTLCAETAGVVPSGTPVRVEHGATLQLPDDTPITVSTFAGSGALKAATGGGIAVTVTNAVRAKCADLFADRYADFPAGITFAPGATFTITDPENLATYSHSSAVTAFTASRVDGTPRLAFEGDVPPGSGLWSFTAKGDGKYTFGPVLGTIIIVK